jgi:hypothetical protein
VSHRSIEILIGRLITDEAFRNAYAIDPATTLARFVTAGYELTPLEFVALQTTKAEVWTRVADQIDPRLQKISLSGEQDAQNKT